jgi:hypothetical protein
MANTVTGYLLRQIQKGPPAESTVVLVETKLTRLRSVCPFNTLSLQYPFNTGANVSVLLWASGSHLRQRSDLKRGEAEEINVPFDVGRQLKQLVKIRNGSDHFFSFAM